MDVIQHSESENPEEVIVSENAGLPERIKVETGILTKLCMPLIIIQILQIGVVILDTLMAGRYSATALSGVAIGGSVWVPCFLFLMGTLSSLTPTVAQFHGGDNLKEIPRYVFQSFWQAMLLSLPFIFLAYQAKPVFEFMKVDPSILPVANGYIQIIIFGLPAVLGFNVLRFFSEGLSLTRPAMYASFVGLLVNFPLNYVLIFGKFGFPELGGIGCAWASMISFWVMFLFMGCLIAFKTVYRPFKLFEKVYGLEREPCVSLIKVGLPIGASHFVESSVFCVIAIMLGSLGPTVVAAHQISLNVVATIFMIPLALSMSLTIRVGFLVGAKQAIEARFTAFLGLAYAILFSLFSATTLYFFRFSIAHLYNDSPEVIELAGSLLTFAVVFQLSDALQVAAAGALRGYKDTRMPMLIAMFSFWGFSLPVGYILGLTDWLGAPWHAKGFWLGLVLGLTVTSLLLVTRLWLISRRAIHNGDHAAPLKTFEYGATP